MVWLNFLAIGSFWVFGPERDVLSAQGHALGAGQRSGFLDGFDRFIPFVVAPNRPTLPSFPGRGPGLTARPFQGRKGITH